MEELWNLASQARETLITPSHEGFATIIDQLCMRQETNEYISAKAMYDFWVAQFKNLSILKLLKLYRCSSNGVLRFRSIYLLSEIRKLNFQLSPVILYEIKPLLISCLMMQETKESDIKILRRIVSFVAYNTLILDNAEWVELGDCILSLADTEPTKAFHVFVDLPIVYGKFIKRIMQKLLDEAVKVLNNPLQDRVEDWSLALETVAKIGVQVHNEETRSNLIKIVHTSANELVKEEMKDHLERGFQDLKKFLARDVNLYEYKYSKDQFYFVGKLVFQIASPYRTLEQGREIGKEVSSLVYHKREKYNYGSGFDRDWYDYLKNLSSLELVRIFASANLEDRSRELVIRRLNVLLSDETSKRSLSNHVSAIRQLEPLVISCLKEERVSDSMFKVLGEVANHVMSEILIWKNEIWYDLRDYVASKSKTEFERAVYIFQCLTMQLDDGEFVIPLVENLSSEINSRLNPPRELLVDNSCWVFAFTGAFCAIIHLIETPSHSGFVKEIAHKMIDSVRELVDRKMEVGLVRRAFRDLERIVKKQLEWYETNEYKFLKGLLWRLYAIEGMKWESKIVLWRINVNLERGLDEDYKELPESELDWINQSED